MKKNREDRPIYYCPVCGYIGVKYNSSICSHPKNKQLSRDTYDKFVKEPFFADSQLSQPLVHTKLKEFIFKQTGFESTIQIDTLNNHVVLTLNHNKVTANKPYRGTYATIKLLVSMGFVIRFTDTNKFCSDDRMTRLYYEFVSRSRAELDGSLRNPNQLVLGAELNKCNIFNDIRIEPASSQGKYVFTDTTETPAQVKSFIETVSDMDLVSVLWDSEVVEAHVIKKSDVDGLLISVRTKQFLAL